MSAYNSEKTLKRAIDSILCGSYRDLELILLDDGSSDNTAEIIREAAEKDSRCVVLKNEKNQGLTKSLNTCLSAARGEFIARMDADDFSHPDRLEKQLGFLASHPEYAFVCSAANLKEDGKIYGKRQYMPRPEKKDLASRCVFIQPTLLIRAEAIKSVGGYLDKSYTTRCEDYDLYFRLYKNGFIGYNMEEALIDYEEKRGDVSKHTPKTRLNEFCVRIRGAAALKNFSGFIKAFKSILLIFVPKRVYLWLKNKRSENIIYDENSTQS